MGKVGLEGKGTVSLHFQRIQMKFCSSLHCAGNFENKIVSQLCFASLVYNKMHLIRKQGSVRYKWQKTEVVGLSALKNRGGELVYKEQERIRNIDKGLL